MQTSRPGSIQIQASSDAGFGRLDEHAELVRAVHFQGCARSCGSDAHVAYTIYNESGCGCSAIVDAKVPGADTSATASRVNPVLSTAARLVIHGDRGIGTGAGHLDLCAVCRRTVDLQEEARGCGADAYVCVRGGTGDAVDAAEHQGIAFVGRGVCSNRSSIAEVACADVRFVAQGRVIAAGGVGGERLIAISGVIAARGVGGER